jgi:acyl carrier protein phosphodiesterase
MPLIRDLCAVVPPVPALAPHIYTGIESIVSQATTKSAATRRTTPKQAVSVEPNALVVLAIAASYLARTYDQLEFEDSLETLIAAAPALLAKHSAPEPEDLADEVAEALERADEEDWKNMAWYTNMQSVLGQKQTHSNLLEDEYADSDQDFAQVRVGGGEMAMYAVDWSSEKLKRDYQAWEKGIRERIKISKR